jgi:hypothetical protein
VVEEEAGDELAPAPDADLLEDRLEMVLHRIRGQIQPAGDLVGRQALGAQLGNHLLTLGEAIGIGDQGSRLVPMGGFDDHGDAAVRSVAEHRPAHQQPLA